MSVLSAVMCIAIGVDSGEKTAIGKEKFCAS